MKTRAMIMFFYKNGKVSKIPEDTFQYRSFSIQLSVYYTSDS